MPKPVLFILLPVQMSAEEAIGIATNILELPQLSEDYHVLIGRSKTAPDYVVNLYSVNEDDPYTIAQIKQMLAETLGLKTKPTLINAPTPQSSGDELG